MATRKLKNGGRRKAPFGSEAIAILAAAGINAATQMAAAGINSSATKEAAQKQAEAIQEQANKQAEALKEQNEQSNELQQKSQEFINEQNSENRELQKDIQLQLQMLTGQQNVNDRLEASKIQVKYGGNSKRKLRLAGNKHSLLQGSNNIPFIVTDGGGVIPIGKTPEGYDLYEIKGNDHEHYHKTKGGKNKTGVGFKFADGTTIEGEGNQNGNQGEYLLNTPDNAYFISRHSISGFNPAKMVNSGMHPLKAYVIQERLKAIKGISDDGKHTSTPIEKMMIGGQPDFVFNMNNQSGPQLGVDTVGDTAVGVAYGSQQEKRQLRNGGRCRRKAPMGDAVWQWGKGWVTTTPQRSYNGPLSYDNQPITVPAGTIVDTSAVTGTIPAKSAAGGNNTTTLKNSNSFWRNADLYGAGLTALGNLGGALITASGNKRAASILGDAYGTASDVLSQAYRNLKTVDTDSIKRENYAAAHAMAALQAPVSFANNKIAKVDRALGRRLSNARRYSLSSAAALERMAQAEIDAQDMRNQIYAADQEQMQRIRQGNAERVNQVAMFNAQQDNEAIRNFTGDYIKLLQYNNDIENQKILGAAGAIGEGAVNSSTAYSKAQTANAAALAQALLGSTQGFTNSLTNMATRKADLEKVLLGANGDSIASYYANPRMSSNSEAYAEYQRLKTQYNSIANSGKSGDKEYAEILRRRINNIATGRGFETV